MKKLIKLFSIILITSMLFSCAKSTDDGTATNNNNTSNNSSNNTGNNNTGDNNTGDNNTGNNNTGNNNTGNNNTGNNNTGNNNTGNNNSSNSNGSPTLFSTDVCDISQFGIQEYASNEADVIEALTEVFNFLSGNTNNGSRIVNQSAKTQYTKVINDVSSFIPKMQEYLMNFINEAELPSEDFDLNEEINFPTMNIVDAVDTIVDFTRTYGSDFFDKSYLEILQSVTPYKDYVSVNDFLLKAQLKYSTANKNLYFATNDKAKVVFHDIRTTMQMQESPLLGAALSYSYDIRVSDDLGKLINDILGSTAQPDYGKTINDSINDFNLKTVTSILLAIKTSQNIGGYFYIDLTYELPQSAIASIFNSAKSKNATPESLIPMMEDYIKISVYVKDDKGNTPFTTTYKLSKIMALLQNFS